jgi:hypothetical protein
MIVTTYTCDRCGHSQDEGAENRHNPGGFRQMWDVSIELRSYTARFVPDRKRLWCQDCCDELRLFESMRDQKPETPPPPSMESIIRDIMRDEMELENRR